MSYFFLTEYTDFTESILVYFASILSIIRLKPAMSNEIPRPDTEVLKDLVRTKMPFGKHKDVLICDLPVSYLEWFSMNGFPAGKLGMLLSTAYVIKSNGLSHLLEELKRGR
ncbi:Uncharacterized conserved protein, DUF3820 family [Siphonobacter aquaeclarae]|uniref:Uncharacterized conserved protein, DUF3820 family n=2 Tax=Siphonobacter aquaeclarae TaxID=563176 RepID=A0A1G9TEH9_9BACT|nr:Uncharacterized conserved protein, DUF3820 family [Siphonobacter aquaeclarae]